MAKRKRRKSQTPGDTPSVRKSEPAVKGPEKPLRVARALSTVLLLVGAVMLFLGGGVLTGAIEEGWGFPMSPVPNWGQPWGAVLVAAAIMYIVGPALLYVRPERGSIFLMIVCGLSVVLGVPVIESTTEILYNLFQDVKSRPIWSDSVWAYFTILHVVICVALYKAYPSPGGEGEVASTG